MNIVTDLKEWQRIRKSFADKSVGFIATMGHLHDGHLSLCQRSKSENDISVVSIFVNPTQFNNSSDFEHYPRTISQDETFLRSMNIDYLFLPDPKEMYPDQYQMKIIETDLSTVLEGEFRPGHFTGMLTVVLKLLNLIQPTRAYFGEKDYQQLQLIKKMVDAFFVPTKIVACNTIRAEDGVALSSRNSRLSKEQREKAKYFPQLLQDTSLNLEEISKKLETLGFKVDYIVERWQRRLGAVWLDDIRLIDNFNLG